MSNSEPFDIPVFPLHTVLFPDSILPLRIFEPRYLEMISDCLRNDHGFAVCLIRSGKEAGPAADFYPVGSMAQIIDWQRGSNGMLNITVQAERRVQILSHQVKANQLVTGKAIYLEAETTTIVHENYASLVTLLKKFYQKYDIGLDEKRQLKDASWVGYRLAEILPMAPDRRQWLMELTNPIVRLDALRELVAKLPTDGDSKSH